MIRERYDAEIAMSAEPEEVFEYFIRPDAIVRWMGDYAVLDPRPGGQFTLDINGVPVRGQYVEVDRPRRLVISWGHAGSERLPPGASTLEVTFTRVPDGTLVNIAHHGCRRPRPSSTRSGEPTSWSGS